MARTTYQQPPGDMSDFKVTARPAAVALGALTMAGRNNQDVMAR